MADLGTNVRYIKGIGEAKAKALGKLGITTLGDLIAYFPRGYEDRAQVRPIRELTAGESVCVRGMVAADLTAYRISGGRTIAKTRVVDDSGSLDLVFFNMEHRRDALHQGDAKFRWSRRGPCRGNSRVSKEASDDAASAEALHGKIPRRGHAP